MIELKMRLHAKKSEVERMDLMIFLESIDAIFKIESELEGHGWKSTEFRYHSVGVYDKEEFTFNHYLKNLRTLVKNNKKIASEICLYNPKSGAADAINIKSGRISHRRDFVECWEHTQGEIPEELLYKLKAMEHEMSLFYFQRLNEYLLQLIEESRPIPKRLIYAYPTWLILPDLANPNKFSVDFDNIMNTV